MEKSPTDIASVSHWESVWKKTGSVRRFSTLNYYDFRLSKVFESLVAPGSRVIEIGCGGSRWIGYFDRVMRCETWGIDYSAEGLAITESSNSGRPRVRLVAGDFFDQSALQSEYFDFIYSLGFIEHFTDAELVTRRMFQILRPGGRVMTLVPNFLSAYGNMQKIMNRATYDKHVIMTTAMLDDAHFGRRHESTGSSLFFWLLRPRCSRLRIVAATASTTYPAYAAPCLLVAPWVASRPGVTAEFTIYCRGLRKTERVVSDPCAAL